MSVTMALTNQIDGWTLRDSAISHVPLNFGPELASPALNQLIPSHVRLQISARGLIFAISHGWKFLSFFFRAKKLSLRVLFFRAFPVRVKYRFHDDKHNLSWQPGQFGCISVRHGSPRFSHTAPAACCWDCICLTELVASDDLIQVCSFCLTLLVLISESAWWTLGLDFRDTLNMQC